MSFEIDMQWHPLIQQSHIMLPWSLLSVFIRTYPDFSNQFKSAIHPYMCHMHLLFTCSLINIVELQ